MLLMIVLGFLLASILMKWACQERFDRACQKLDAIIRWVPVKVELKVYGRADVWGEWAPLQNTFCFRLAAVKASPHCIGQEVMISELNRSIIEKDRVLGERDAELAELKDKLAHLRVQQRVPANDQRVDEPVVNHSPYFNFNQVGNSLSNINDKVRLRLALTGF